MKLNVAQQKASLKLTGPTLVLAGAGSGKTRVITDKIVRLIRTNTVAARHIAAVTFTNKAANEMRRRVRDMAGGEDVRGLTVCTFHALGLQIVRRQLEELNLKKGFSIFDQTDTLGVLKELFGDNTVADVEQLQWQISALKNQAMSPEQALAAAQSDIETFVAQAYADYARLLSAYNAVDFDDLIYLPSKLFAEHELVRQAWSHKLRYLLVDEYQDTNTAQYELFKQLASHGNFTVVGDDDQSIYGWRGAEPKNLLLLKDDFPELELIKLEQNYRSSRRILRAANKVIANNPHVFEKKLWSELDEGSPIRIVSRRHGDDECEWVVGNLVSHQLRTGAKYSDYAILYRGNHQSRGFERRLREHGVPYLLSGGTSFFERAEIKDALAYVRLLVNHDDDSAFLRVINTPRREIGAQTLEKLGGYAKERGVSLFRASGELGLSHVLSAGADERLKRFHHWLTGLAASGMSPESTFNQILDDIQYFRWLEDQAGDRAGGERRVNNVLELAGWLKDLAENKDLSEIVSHLALLNVMERQEEDEADDQVTLMTLHASKGLEFKYVYMVGMEEELLPHQNSMHAEGIEEERRLAYVGITRAQRQLTMTFAQQRRRYGDYESCDPSRFLYELPEADVIWEGEGVEKDPAQQREIGLEHLASLKALLEK